MEALGGTVFRIARSDVEHKQYAREVAAIKSDIAQLKAERAKSRAEHQARLQTKIDKLEKKLDAKLEQAKQRSEQQEKEAKARVKALEKKAAESKGEAKAAIEKRIADMNERLKKSSEDFDKWYNQMDAPTVAGQVYIAG
jgi:DNA anti-recombination protein RmuC